MTTTTRKRQKPPMGVPRMVEWRGETVELRKLAEEAGLAMSTVRQRIDTLGWSIEEALATPARRKVEKATAASAAPTPIDVLSRLGYIVEDAGRVPAGTLILVRGAK
jgi:hypothetical protein